MIVLNASNTADLVVVTLEEDRTIENPWYHFVFTHISSNEKVVVSVDSANDQSSYKRRFNLFIFNTAVLFANAKPGQYTYDVYESTQPTYDPDAELHLLETGRMLLKNTATTTFTGKTTNVRYEGYTG